MPKIKVLAIAAVASMLALSPALAQTTPAPAPDQSAAPSDTMKKPMKTSKAKHAKMHKSKKMEEKKPM